MQILLDSSRRAGMAELLEESTCVFQVAFEIDEFEMRYIVPGVLAT
jgi:hypothetical protein